MQRTAAVLHHLVTCNEIEIFPSVDGMKCSIYDSGCATVVLDREEAMNSLSLRNITFLFETLLRWERDSRVTHIVIYPAHIFGGKKVENKKKKAFCAGGDLKEFISCDRTIFTYREYRMDCLIQKYQKPIISIMDGVVMGGGAGLGCLCRYRIVTPNSLFAMPEVIRDIYCGKFRKLILFI